MASLSSFTFSVQDAESEVVMVLSESVLSDLLHIGATVFNLVGVVVLYVGKKKTHAMLREQDRKAEVVGMQVGDIQVNVNGRLSELVGMLRNAQTQNVVLQHAIQNPVSPVADIENISAGLGDKPVVLPTRF